MNSEGQIYATIYVCVVKSNGNIFNFQKLKYDDVYLVLLITELRKLHIVFFSNWTRDFTVWKQTKQQNVKPSEDWTGDLCLMSSFLQGYSFFELPSD